MVGLAEAYHGDTLGAMSAVPPTPYNGRLQAPWYSPRGLFLEAPTLALVEGEWTLRLPAALAGRAQQAQQAQQAQRERLPSREAAFDAGRDGSELAGRYERYIRGQLAQHAQREGAGAALAALIIEPVLQARSC